MNDRTSHFQNDNELKFSREQGFFDKNVVVRWIIASIFMLSLFLFLHFREVRVEILELNSIAPSYVVSQIDFDFMDEEATIIMKQEAVTGVGRIYGLLEREIRARRTEFEQELVTNQDWRKGKASFEEMYAAAAVMEKTLQKLRLTVGSTFEKIKEVGMPTSYYQIYAVGSSPEKIVLPESIWNGVKDISFPGSSFEDSTETLIINYFKKFSWQMEPDVSSERTLRRKMQAAVSDKFTHVTAGSRIIDQGERVTSRHIAMLQAMKTAMSESRNLWQLVTLFGTAIITLFLTGICVGYFYVNYPRVLNSNRKLFLLVTIVLLTLLLTKSIEMLLLTSNSHLIEYVRYPVLVPFAAILAGSMMNSGIATFTTGFLTIVLMMTLPFEVVSFAIINITTATVAILCIRSLRRRKEIFIVCVKAWLASAAIIIALHAYDNSLFTYPVLTDILCSAVFMFLTAILVVGLLPLFESVFRIMTDVSLMEYMDPNNDLLRRLTIEAPGTYQHSVVVGNLAEAAALSIGANGLFCRVSTLYHDIGKMSTAQYFTENQHGEMNIHQLLTPLESAQVIMAHVSEGVAMARKAGLPEQIIDIIKEHHGTTLVYYFYRKEIERVGNDKNLVNEKDFRYSGPRPRSKESAIIMITDSFEAASRSLDRPDEASLMDLINRLARDKAEDGQFDECLLTFEELNIVKKTLVKTLLAAGHSRIKYPGREIPKVNFVEES